MAQIVQRTEDDKGYLAAIFDVTGGRAKRKNAFPPKIVKRVIGIYPTLVQAVQAHNACKKARGGRDKRVYNASSSSTAPTHLQVLIVSKAFSGQSHSKRIRIVYEALLKPIVTQWTLWRNCKDVVSGALVRWFPPLLVYHTFSI